MKLADKEISNLKTQCIDLNKRLKEAATLLRKSDNEINKLKKKV